MCIVPEGDINIYNDTIMITIIIYFLLHVFCKKCYGKPDSTEPQRMSNTGTEKDASNEKTTQNAHQSMNASTYYQQYYQHYQQYYPYYQQHGYNGGYNGYQGYDTNSNAYHQYYQQYQQQSYSNNSTQQHTGFSWDF